VRLTTNQPLFPATGSPCKRLLGNERSARLTGEVGYPEPARYRQLRTVQSVGLGAASRRQDQCRLEPETYYAESGDLTMLLQLGEYPIRR